MQRNVVILAVCQALMMSGGITVALLGGIIGTALAPDPAWSTLPVSIMMVGVGLGTVPAALLMRRIGRRAGFVLAAAAAAAWMLLAAHAVGIGSFFLFCLAALLLGAMLAFTHQYRFAAAESVEAPAVGRAVAFVLLGTLAAAYLGPEVAERAKDLLAATYAGPFVVLAGMSAGAALLLLFLRAPAPQEAAAGGDGRPLAAVLRQAPTAVAMLGGVVAYTVMNFVMTATPISMHVHHGFSLGETAAVIQSHILAMYAPSLVSGYILQRLGVLRVMLIGAVAMSGCALLAVAGRELAHYWGALVLLGLGWNFLFVGGTTLLTQSYRPEERFKVQAVNDFSIFGVTAMGSLLAGLVVHRAGWGPLNLLTLPPLGVMLLALAWLARLQARPSPVTGDASAG